MLFNRWHCIRSRAPSEMVLVYLPNHRLGNAPRSLGNDIAERVHDYRPAASRGASRIRHYHMPGVILGTGSKHDRNQVLKTFADCRSDGQLQVKQTFQAVTIDQATAEPLQVSPDSAALWASSIFTLAHGEPIELRTAIYPSGRYIFNVRCIVTMGQTEKSR